MHSGSLIMQFLFIILVFRVENTFYQALTGYRQYDLMVSIQGGWSVAEDKKQSFEDELISAFLTKSTEKARQQIADEGKLSTENAIPLMLKSQYNHIAHLDEQMVTKTEFNGEIKSLKEQMVTKAEFNGEIKSLKEQMVTKAEFNGEIKSLKEQMVTKPEFNALKEQFNGLKDQVGFMKWMIMLGFALLAALQVYTSFIL